MFLFSVIQVAPSSIVRPRPSSIKLQGTPGILPKKLSTETQDETDLHKSQLQTPRSSIKEEILPTITEFPTDDSDEIIKRQESKKTVPPPKVSTQSDNQNDILPTVVPSSTVTTSEPKDHTVVTIEQPPVTVVAKPSVTPKKVVGGKWL